ncbi:DNA-packaging protein [Nitratireductor sp. StC3]|uniref:DNA-packaging protein n=1 Tax=Nitratireductor sp. StC3 TaxID=2126741 RepID=UPI001FE03F8D|nr:DNA-packaging protein [Nitratireductor sp. StC3]
MNTGQFIKGNRFWEARSSHGAKPKFAKAGELWSACREYFEWVEANPLYEDKLVIFQGTATHEPVAKMRAMTIQGLCIFLDINFDTWVEWRKTRSDLSDVIARVEAIIRDQKFSGAAADLLNANIIARDLGLVDHRKQDGELTVKDERAPDEIAAAIAGKLAGLTTGEGKE